MIKIKAIAQKIILLVLVVALLPVFNGNYVSFGDGELIYPGISKLNIGGLQTNQETFYDENVIYRLPETVESNDEISVIVTMNMPTVVETYVQTGGKQTLSEFITSREAQKISSAVADERKQLLRKLNSSGIDFELGDQYDTVLSGFEITLKAKDFDKISSLLKGAADLIVGEVYAPAETEVVTNYVDVYETGIFDTSASEFQGDGVVVAVLDTGLDYTHTAFSVNNFTTSNEAFTLQSVSGHIKETTAAGFTDGLAAEDVYINRKVPFAYDYADKDPDVFPINSSHGTHVAGIIAGKDDTVTGVAPNAQLAIMKVFSDIREGAKTSWILSALEDCVILGVDVINMSLGSGCGFTREVDLVKVSDVYDSIRDAGISLIASAANSYNATLSSDKNGSNGLTSNPDSGTVGSPSTYEAALSVASVDGVKTSYLVSGGKIIYFNEASTSSVDKKSFVSDILSTAGTGVNSHDFEYVTIPGLGRSSDYLHPNSYYQGKIVLVKRGILTFEDKVRVALNEKGAAGIIIYNNVSGSISMSVGKDIGAVCSISQDEGERLAAAGSGIITVSRNNLAGPFMSDFSSWGPTSDLRIKPEITSHGGEILSAVPGQGYERLSGTSMAAPNQAGAAALIRQYVKYSGVFGTDLTPEMVTARVNQLMMSTADIVLNKNGLPYAVRKQGAGLVNITNSATSAAFLTTFDSNGQEMDKTKLELGDDKSKSGVYQMTFAINNVSSGRVSYDISAILMTEGVSTTYTSHSDTTVTQDGRLLSGSQTSVTAVTNGTQDGNKVSVDANKTATVTVKVVLSQADKQYMDESFEHGMYVEGFVMLDALSGTNINLNVPLLAFYGDWTEAPIFDEEYYDTHRDEINAGLDPEDKLMADAYATRVIGRLYNDYITTLGSYYFIQNPALTPIAANKDYISVSNQQSLTNSAVNGIRSIWAGFLRNVKEVEMSVTEESTGREIFSKTSYNQRKSFSSGGSIYYSSIDMDFGVLEQNLKNNTKYNVKITTYIDYGAKEDQKNTRNVFEFPLYIDFEAPVVADVSYRTEYDRTTQKTKLFADLSIYDNHYAMGVQIGQIIPADPESGYSFSLDTFGKYITPVYSSFNSTSTVSFELTDYISRLKESVGIGYKPDGSFEVEQKNSFIAICYDYAMNSATYEIPLPDHILSMYFTEEEIALSPNETKDLTSLLNIYPSESWLQILDFTSSDTQIVDVVNQTLIAKSSGTATITVVGRDADGNQITASTEVRVLAPGEEGYQGGHTIPEINKFTLTGYETTKAFFSLSSADRDIGLTGSTTEFNGNYRLSMFPSESVNIQYILDSYFPDKTSVTYKSGNNNIATVSETGQIVAQAQGTTSISVNVMFDGKSTLYSGRITISVKDPFTANSIYLMSYRGLGGTVVIPNDRGITTIYPYAFSNYEFVVKDLSQGDVIDEEDPYLTKQSPIGEDTITKIIIPEGVTDINAYAFARLTALEEVVLPSTLKNIGVGAFSGCTSLKTINLEKVKFINEKAFADCALEYANFGSVVAIGNYAFENCRLSHIILPESSQSVGNGAFYGNSFLDSAEFHAPKLKIGSYVFAECPNLVSIYINASVIASYAFYNSSELEQVTLGKDVAVINEFAFAGTKVAKFTIDSKNKILTTDATGALIYKGSELVLVAPQYASNEVTTDAASIAKGAFSGNNRIFRVKADNATVVGPYAFAYCANLVEVSLSSVEQIGDFAFIETAITQTPNLSNISRIGNYAFAFTDITSVTIADNAVIGNYAFAYCTKLKTVTLGDNVTLGEAAFYCPIGLYTYENTGSFDYYSVYNYEVKDETGAVVKTLSYYRYNFNVGVTSGLTSVEIGGNAVIGDYAFAGNAKLSSLTLGDGAKIGAYSFFNNAALTSVDLSKAEAIGEFAFSGTRTQDYWVSESTWNYAYLQEVINGETVIYDYVYTSFAPAFAEVDLTNLAEIGVGAFAYNTALTNVVFGSRLSAVGDYAFMGCSGLSEVTLPEQVSDIGTFTFYGTSLSQIDLSNVSTVGAYAFALTPLTQVTFKDGVSIANGAFIYCGSLTDAVNLKNASSIGTYAFSRTALTEIHLENTVTVGDFAFALSAVTSVKFGNKLESLGENPFYGCLITTFGRETDIVFNNKVIGTRLEESYDVSKTVKVINGVLYQAVPKGLELVSYPLASARTAYTLEEGTVRISAMAFAGTVLEYVTLPSTLKAIGDKAFYGCRNLSVVIFKSYYAPILEEAYDTSYLTYENLPFTGSMGEYEGLGISKFYMWNITSSFNNFYFGANFVNYIGHITKNITMVKPANGQNYNTFILSQYFKTVANGSNAASEATLRVIDLINALPKSITLADESLVVAARSAYNSLPLVEQQALVNNYSALLTAESTIEYLKLRVDPEPEPVPAPQPSKFAKFLQDNYVGIIIAGVAVLASAGYITFEKMRNRQKNG